MIIKYSIHRDEEGTGFADVDTSIDLGSMTREDALWVALVFQNLALALEKGSRREQKSYFTRTSENE